MKRTRVLTDFSAALVIAAGIGLVVTDATFPSVNGYWIRHPLVTNLASSILMLVLGLTIVQRWIERTNRRQWKTVTFIAFQDLAREVMLFVRLMAEVCGESDFRSRSARPLLDQEAEKIHGLLNARLSHGKEAGTLPRDKRLRLLIEDAVWCELVYKAIQHRSEEARACVARWAPVMVGHKELSATLTEVADLITNCKLIQEILVKLVVDRKPVEPADIDLWLRDWDNYEESCNRVHSRLVPDAYMYRVARNLAN